MGLSVGTGAAGSMVVAGASGEPLHHALARFSPASGGESRATLAFWSRRLAIGPLRTSLIL